MQPSSLRSLGLCGESKVARGRCGACGRSAESPASGLQSRYHQSARWCPRAGDPGDLTPQTPSAPREQSRCRPFGWALWVSAVNRRSLGGGAALAGGPRSRPQAGSYVVSTCRLVGARLRATRWISPQRRRVRRETKVDAALFSALSGSLR
jgi:hypothetical protein